MFLKASPLISFMSLSFRRLRYSTCKPINNRFKIRLKCIALSKGITQTFLGCCPWQLLMLYQLNKNWHRFHEWLFVCTNFILCTHQTTLLVPQYWHHNLVMTVVKRMNLFTVSPGPISDHRIPCLECDSRCHSWYKF